MQNNSRSLQRITQLLIFVLVAYSKPACAQSMPSLPDNQLVLPAKTYTIPFLWQGDSVHSKWEPHTAILIPVKLKNCPKLFFMQFDLGSPYSLFYTNKLAAIQSKYPKAIPLNGQAGKLVNFSFTAGKMPVLAKEIAVKQFDSTAIDWSKQSVEIIGTIGSDLIDGKTVVIDYPGNKLTLSDSIPSLLMPQLSLTGFIYARRSVLLPASIQGKQTMLYFDTGSSMYELLTSKKICETLAAPGSEFLQSKVRSWDKYVTANSIATNDSIAIGGTSIPIHYATYIEGVSSAQTEQMMKMGIGGMTGNKLFLDYILVLDTKHKKMGLVRRVAHN